MKSKAQPLTNYSANPLKSVSNEVSNSPKKDSRSPYLRAILSGTNNLFIQGKILSAVYSDREAALRYIRESRMLQK